jgi:hypothetical protein
MNPCHRTTGKSPAPGCGLGRLARSGRPGAEAGVPPLGGVHVVDETRQVVEPDRLLPARELAGRVCDALGCPYHEHIPIPEQAA